MKKLFLLVALMLAFAVAPAVQAAAAFNQPSFDKISALTSVLNDFIKNYAEGELETLAAKAKNVNSKAAAVKNHNFAAEAPEYASFRQAGSAVKAAAAKLESVTAQMIAAADADDEQQFITYESGFNKAVSEFNTATKTYDKATSEVTAQVQLYQYSYIFLVVTSGLITIGLSFWAFTKRSRDGVDSKGRKIVTAMSLVPLAISIVMLTDSIVGLYNSANLSFILFLAGELTLIATLIWYGIRQRRRKSSSHPASL